MADIFDEVAGGATAVAPKGDIFDQVAPSPQPSSDIFDQVAAQPPAAAKPDIFDHVAATAPALPALPSLEAASNPPQADSSPFADLPRDNFTSATSPGPGYTLGSELANAGSATAAGFKKAGLTLQEMATNTPPAVPPSAAGNPAQDFQNAAPAIAGETERLQGQRDIAAQQQAEAMGQIHSPLLKAATPIVAGISPAMVAGAVNPIAGIVVAGAQTGADVYDSTERTLRQQHPEMDATQRRSTAGLAGAGAGMGAGAVAMIPGAQSVAGTLAHGAATGAGFDLSAQIAEKLATGKPIDWKQVGGSAAFGTVMAGGMKALHAMFKGREVPQEHVDAMAKATTPEEVQSIVADARQNLAQAVEPEAARAKLKYDYWSRRNQNATPWDQLSDRSRAAWQSWEPKKGWIQRLATGEEEPPLIEPANAQPSPAPAERSAPQTPQEPSDLKPIGNLPGQVPQQRFNAQDLQNALPKQSTPPSAEPAPAFTDSIDQIAPKPEEKRPAYNKPPKGTSEPALAKRIIEKHDEIFGNEDASLQEGSRDADQESALGNYANATTFQGRKYPEEIRKIIIAHPELKAQFRLTDTPTEAGGEDAYSGMGEDRYVEALKSMAGTKSRVARAKERLRGMGDPETDWLIAEHDNLVPAAERPKQELADVSQMKPGTTFTKIGEPFKVAKDADGYVTVKDGGHYPEVPIEAVGKTAIDKGSLSFDATSDTHFSKDEVHDMIGKIGVSPETATGHVGKLIEQENANAAAKGNDDGNLSAQPGAAGEGGTTEPPSASSGDDGAREVTSGTGSEESKLSTGTAVAGGKSDLFGNPTFDAKTGEQERFGFGQDDQAAKKERAKTYAPEIERKELARTVPGETETDKKIAQQYKPDATGELPLGEAEKSPAAADAQVISDAEKSELLKPMAEPAGEMFRANVKDPSDAAIKDAAAWLRENGGASDRIDAAKKLGAEFGGKALKHGTAVWKEMNRPPDNRVLGLGGTAGGIANKVNASPFIQTDLKPRVIEAAKGILDAKDDIQKTLAPQTRSEQARVAANLTRESAATIAQRYDRAEAALDNARKLFASQKPDVNYKFIDDVENGRPTGSPATDSIAKTMRDLLDSRRVEVQRLGKGKLQQFYENYFPHIWDDPAKAKSIVGQVFGKRPLEGSKSFLKKRSIVTVADGLAAGLKPVSDNPVELTLLKVREMDRYIMGQRLLRDLKSRGLAKFVRATERAPEGYARINDGIAQVYGPPTIKVSEWQDPTVYEGLQKLAKDIGIEHVRDYKFPRSPKSRALGLSYQGEGYIETRNNTPESVLAHEIGHQMDVKFGMYDRFFNNADAKLRPDFKRELRKLADLRNATLDMPEGEARPSTRKRVEQIAHIMQAYIGMPERFKATAPKVFAEFEKMLRENPKLQQIRDIQPSLNFQKIVGDKPHGGLLKFGEYQAPEAVAQVLNNYLSPGLRQKGWYRAINGAGNVMNQAQLGMSAYHLGFTSLDAATSKLAVGIDEAMAGHPIKGIVSAAQSPLAPFSNFFHGDKILKEWYSPGSQGADVAAMADAVRRAGGRVRLESQYRTDMTKRMTDAFHQGNYVGAALRLPFAAIEQASRPILEYIVPRQKLGIFADMAKQGIEKLGPNAATDDLRAELAKAWDSADNRMGQVVYDNLFWNKAAKDLAMISVRSVGWNLGTARELGGGALDFGKAGASLARGRTPEWTRRMSYTVALPAMTALVGGVLHYAMTGSAPQELKDYFFPQTGGVDENGRPSRVSLPSYMKDLYSIAEHPFKTATDKLHPLISTIADMLQNHDYYNVKIRNEDDPIVKQLLDTAKFAGKQMTPFGVRGYQQQKERGEPFAKRAASFIGVTPAPSFLDQTAAEKLASSLHHSTDTRTSENAERSKLKHELSKALKMRESDVGQRIASAIRAGKLFPQDRNDIIRAARQTTLQRQIDGLDAEDAVRVFKIATPTEKKEVGSLITEKVARAKAITPERRRELYQFIREQTISGAGSQ